MQHFIYVERDPEGLQLALRALFEEGLIRHRLAPMLEKADAETIARAEDDMPERELSPGYFNRAAYLLDLSITMATGVQMDATMLTRADVLGLQAVRTAKADYERDHPACPACGERQDNRWMKQCFSCHTKFGGKGN